MLEPPKWTKDLKINKFYALKLANLIETNNHIMVYGASSSGKRCIVKTVLNDYIFDKYNIDDSDVPLVDEHIKIESSKEFNVFVRKGRFCYEIDASNLYGSYDTHVVTHIYKLLSSEYTLDNECNLVSKFLIIYNINKLSKEAHNALKRIIEKRNSACVVICTCNNVSSLDVSFRGRFLTYRLPKPNVMKLQEFSRKLTNKKILVTESDTIFSVIKKINDYASLSVEFSFPQENELSYFRIMIYTYTSQLIDFHTILYALGNMFMNYVDHKIVYSKMAECDTYKEHQILALEKCAVDLFVIVKSEQTQK